MNKREEFKQYAESLLKKGKSRRQVSRICSKKFKKSYVYSQYLVYTYFAGPEWKVNKKDKIEK